MPIASPPILAVQPKRSLPILVLIMTLVWIPTVMLLSDRINLGGADCSSVNLEYQKTKFGCKPQLLTLQDSYETWSKFLSGTDMSTYIAVGLGFADGKGISEKVFESSPITYKPYYFQGAGTPFLIGSVVRLFGQKNVYPYFLVVAFLRLLTAILIVRIAKRIGLEGIPLEITALTALLAWPIIDYSFGVGLFASEAPSEPLIAAAVLCLSRYVSGRKSLRNLIINAVGFGFFLGLCSYFREIYGLFCLFAIAIIAFQLSRQKLLLHGISFAALAFLSLTITQLPWKLRNQTKFNEFTMSDSQYYGSALLFAQWYDYTEAKKWCPNCGLGIGNYLRPASSKEILAGFEDKKIGSQKAFAELFTAVVQQPRRALRFKLNGADTLWLGQRRFVRVRLWCLIQLSALMFFLVFSKKRYLEIAIFPLFVLCLSTVIHYEPRFAFPIYEVSVPLVWGLLSKRYLPQLFRSNTGNDRTESQRNSSTE